MATTLQNPRFNNPRPSTETDRRQLLAESTAPSETSSIYTATDGDRTPRASSPARSTQTQTQRQTHTRHQSMASPAPSQSQSYRGFPSQAAYLSALQQWADSKKYLEPLDTGLKGFYGETTMEDYAARPKAFQGEGLGLKKKWRARKQSRAEEKGRKEEGERSRLGRRATVT